MPSANTPKLPSGATLIAQAKNVIYLYKKDCEAFSIVTAAGREGEARKIRLMNIIDGLDSHVSAAYIFYQLDKFCDVEKDSSRLRNRLKTHLLGLMGVQMPVLKADNRYVYPMQVEKCLELYKEKVAQLMLDAGIENSNDVPLNVMTAVKK